MKKHLSAALVFFILNSSLVFCEENVSEFSDKGLFTASEKITEKALEKKSAEKSQDNSRENSQELPANNLVQALSNPETQEKEDADKNYAAKNTTPDSLFDSLAEENVGNEEAGSSTKEATSGTEKKTEYKKLSLEGSEREEVQKFRELYLTEKRQGQLKQNLEDAIDYRLYVRKAIQDMNLPPELEYLPIVESNYKTYARSKSGAVGIWQFMENSVKPFLELNDYVDERFDPWKETDAALKKLNDNYNYFKDWLLAIAAYNCGAGALSRALAKTEEKNFWSLCKKNLIPEQTKQYVPKLIAIADISINSEWYGTDIPNHEEEFESLYNEKNGIFDYISVHKAYSLSQLAQKLRIDENLMKELNPSFILGFTHPSKESKIRLPQGTRPAAEDAIASLSPIEFPFKYKVVQGDSLWSISRKYKVSISSICELNGINENDILRIGKILYIPSK